MTQLTDIPAEEKSHFVSEELETKYKYDALPMKQFFIRSHSVLDFDKFI